VELGAGLSTTPVSGRLLIIMTKGSEAKDLVKPSIFDLDKFWIAAQEIHNLATGGTVAVNSDTLVYPAAFSTAPAGDYQVMALLDVDHSFTYSDMGAGDLRSVPLSVSGLNPAETRPLN
jgi:hypothetical protein